MNFKKKLIGLVLIQAFSTSLWAMDQALPKEKPLLLSAQQQRGNKRKLGDETSSNDQDRKRLKDVKSSSSSSSSSSINNASFNAEKIRGLDEKDDDVKISNNTPPIEESKNPTITLTATDFQDITLVKAKDQSAKIFELELFSASNFYKTTVGQDPTGKYAAVEEIMKSSVCQSTLQSKDDLNIFYDALSIIQDGQSKAQPAHIRVLALLNQLRHLTLTFEQIYRHWEMAYYLDINELSVALSALLISKHFNKLQALINQQKKGKLSTGHCPASQTCQEIEQFIAHNYTQPGFTFLEWYNLLPAEHKANSIRTKVLTKLDTQATALVQKSTDRIDEKTRKQVDTKTAIADVKNAFATLPDGYFSIRVRQAYQQQFHENIDRLDIVTIIQRINDADGEIELADFGITTPELVGIHDLLSIRNEVHPIVNLDLNNNQITTLPQNFGQGWTRLQNLGLQDNQLTTLPQGIGKDWTRLQWLSIENNQLTQLPQGFGLGWPSLDALYLNDNPLTQKTRTQLKQLHQLDKVPIVM